MRRKPGPAILTLAIGLLSSGVVHTAESPAKVRAKRLFDEGLEAIRHDNWDGGCAKLRESLGLFAVPNTLFNVADCDEHEGNFALAYEHLERALSLVSNGDPRARIGKKRLAGLEEKVARLSIVVPPALGSITILMDGQPIAAEAFKQARVVNVGKHVVITRLPGHEDEKQEVELGPRDRTEIVLRAGPPSKVVDGDEQAGTITKLRVTSFIALGVGVAGAIAAGVTGGLLLARDKQIADHCQGFSCDKTGFDLARGQQPLLIGNAVAWGVGAAGLGAGTLLFLLDKRAQKQSSAALMPWMTNHFVGIGVMGRF